MRTGRRLSVAGPVQERLGERADDRGHALCRAPVAAVPPDTVAAVHLGRRGALRRLDAVDEVEPVDARAAADGGRCTARSRRRTASRRRRRAAAGASPSPRTAASRRCAAARHVRAEVARHRHADRVVLRGPGAQPAAAERTAQSAAASDGGDGTRRAHQRTVKTTRLRACAGRAAIGAAGDVAGAVDRLRVEHVAPGASAPRAAGSSTTRRCRSRRTVACSVPQRAALTQRAAVAVEALAARARCGASGAAARRSRPDGSAATVPRSSRGPLPCAKR